MPVSGRCERVACTDFFVEVSVVPGLARMGAAVVVSVVVGVVSLLSSIRVVCTVEFDFILECFVGVLSNDRRLRLIEAREKDEVPESSPDEDESEESLDSDALPLEARDWSDVWVGGCVFRVFVRSVVVSVLLLSSLTTNIAWSSSHCLHSIVF